MGRQLYTEAPSHKLSAMLYEVGLPVREEHDALEDAADCRRICRRMAGQCNFRFMDFIMDSNWYHTVDQQWNWTFPNGYPTFWKTDLCLLPVVVFKTFYEDSTLLRALRNFLVRIPVKQTQCDVCFKPSEYAILPHPIIYQNL